MWVATVPVAVEARGKTLRLEGRAKRAAVEGWTPYGGAGLSEDGRRLVQNARINGLRRALEKLFP
jgi:hypothetical protein